MASSSKGSVVGRRILQIAAAILAMIVIGYAGFAAREHRTPDQPWKGASYIELDSGRTHYFDIGPRDAPAILLFHGSARGIADWQEGFAQELATKYRVIAFDYFGNGFSDRGFGFSYGMDLWARQGIELLDALDIREASFVGHSSGGVFAAAAAKANPDRALAVVTIGTGEAMDPMQALLLIPGIGEITLAAQAMYSETFSPAHQQFIHEAHNINGSRHAFLVYVRRQYTIDGLRIISGLFSDLPVDVMHISGGNDDLIPISAARRTAAKSGGDFVIIEGVGHDVHVDAPSELAKVIDGYLASTQKKTPKWRLSYRRPLRTVMCGTLLPRSSIMRQQMSTAKTTMLPIHAQNAGQKRAPRRDLL